MEGAGEEKAIHSGSEEEDRAWPRWHKVRKKLERSRQIQIHVRLRMGAV